MSSAIIQAKTPNPRKTKIVAREIDDSRFKTPPMTTLNARPQAALWPQSVFAFRNKSQLSALPHPVRDRRMKIPQPKAKRYGDTALTVIPVEAQCA
jgi:hypothetical protein